MNKEYFNGKIDQLQIWDNALTQQEINQYMHCSPSGNESGLSAFWAFEEGSGNIVYDLTINGNDGMIHGATYSTEAPNQFCQLT